MSEEKVEEKKESKIDVLRKEIEKRLDDIEERLEKLEEGLW